MIMVCGMDLGGLLMNILKILMFGCIISMKTAGLLLNRAGSTRKCNGW